MKLLYAITLLASIVSSANAAVTELPEESFLYLKACYNMLQACNNHDTNLMMRVADDFADADPGQISAEDIISETGSAGKPDYYFDVNAAEDLLINNFDLASLDSEHAVRSISPDLNVHTFSLEPKASYSFTIQIAGSTVVSSTTGSAKAIPVLAVSEVSDGNVEAPVTNVTDCPAVFSVVNIPDGTIATIKVSVTNPDTEKQTFAVVFQ